MQSHRPSSPVLFTSLEDISRVVASLATLLSENISSNIHVSGDTRTFLKISEIIRDSGARQIEVFDIPFQNYKEEVTFKSSWDPAP
jgi:hypothetical protein